MGGFTYVCTLFTYQDREKYAMIYRDKVFKESGENLEKSRKNEVILRYARKNQGAHDLSRQHLPFPYGGIHFKRHGGKTPYKR